MRERANVERRRTDDLVGNNKAGRFEERVFSSLPEAKGAYNSIYGEKTQKKVPLSLELARAAFVWESLDDGSLPTYRATNRWL